MAAGRRQIMFENMAAFWLAAIVVFLVVEALVPGLVSIWFAFGALGAFVSAVLHAPIWLQIVWFLLLSILSLCLTRPLAKKYVNGKTQPTNADMVIGRECVVNEEINNLLATGAVSVGGKVWTARSENDDIIIPTGKTVVAMRIEGVKLIVRVSE